MTLFSEKTKCYVIDLLDRVEIIFFASLFLGFFAAVLQEFSLSYLRFFRIPLPFFVSWCWLLSPMGFAVVTCLPIRFPFKRAFLIGFLISLIPVFYLVKDFPEGALEAFR